MKTLVATATPRAQRTWHLVDAEGQTLGRLCTQIARLLMGKDRTDFTPHVDNGDYVVVINAEKVAVTGSKEDSKMYRRHSGFMGGLTELTLRQVRVRSGEMPIVQAVTGMLPKNNLRRSMLERLKVVTGAKHPYEAQKPTPIKK